MNKDITIRRLLSIDEMRQVQRLETMVWNNAPLSLNQTITASKNGGLLLGAYLNEELIGFSYGFSGFANGISYLCSHMLGIDPRYREQGIGAQLKLEQRKLALEMGYHLIVWTYDPLETRNGYLNLSKLGAVCSTYVDNCYGDMEDSLNRGIPSDRFKVEWWISSPHVKAQPFTYKEESKTIFNYDVIAGLPKLLDSEVALDEFTRFEKQVLVPVPANYQELKRKDNSLAIEWRFKTRQIFHVLFAKGYVAASLIKGTDEGVHHYLLVQKDTLQLGDVR